jgi:hypothetical protein
MEVLRTGGNWIQLAGSWEDLCAPAPLPLFQSTGNGATPVPIPSPPPSGRPKALLPGPDNGDGAATTTTSSSLPINKLRKDRIHQQAVLDALADERVTDESSLRLAIRTRRQRAERDYRLDNAVAALDAKLMQCSPSASPNNATVDATNSNGKEAASTSPLTAAAPPANGRRPASSSVFDDGPAHPFSSTERAIAIARWVLEAPPPSAGSSTAAGGGGEGLRKRRKKPVKKGGVVTTTGSAGATVGGNVKGEGDLEDGREVVGEVEGEREV